METRANYALIGAFTLAIVIGAFAFVFWFSGAEKPSGLAIYKVVFKGSISGLSTGNPVLFNGVRVGEVQKIDLMPQDPSQVYALISVDTRVPVRTNTKVELEYTGLTGSASVGLSGESSAAPALVTSDKVPGVLYANKSSLQDLMATAKQVAARANDILDKGDKLIDDASPALKASINNLQKFTDALASNSDGLKDFMSSVSEVGRAIKPLAVKMETLASDADNVVKAIDPKEVKQMLADYSGTAAKLNAAAGKVDGVLTNLNGFLSTTDSKGVFEQVSDAAKSLKKLAENTDLRTRELFLNLTRFSRDGLREYTGLASDGRTTVAEITKLIRSIEANPQQFLFGRK
jgi:phospholipid/cholesterol/gamma-HCH transport system substrate-binding protein